MTTTRLDALSPATEMLRAYEPERCPLAARVAGASSGGSSGDPCTTRSDRAAASGKYLDRIAAPDRSRTTVDHVLAKEDAAP